MRSLSLVIMWRFGARYRLLPWIAMALTVGAVHAAELELAGVLGNKAVVIVDGGAPRTLAVGEQTRDGVRLIDVSGTTAVVEVEGRRVKLTLGSAPLRASRDETPGDGGASLYADATGHHFTMGSINGAAVRFLVDTGASMVSIGMSDARRAGIDYRRGQAVTTATASGPARAWRVKLDSVRVGDITLHGVDGMVHENDLPFVLLGMSFLNRMDMQRDGDRLVLRKRF